MHDKKTESKPTEKPTEVPPPAKYRVKKVQFSGNTDVLNIGHLNQLAQGQAGCVIELDEAKRVILITSSDPRVTDVLVVPFESALGWKLAKE
jgi:hypothetical protein